MEKLTITSLDFEPEGWMPDRNSGFGEDFSPELRIEGICDGTVSMAIMLDDLDHPIWPGYNHWVAWNIPPENVLPAHLPEGGVIEQPIHAEQGLAYGKHCYRGPKPPLNGKHRYRFTLYTLDCKLVLGPDANKAAVLQAMEGHILQTACLHGKYQRHHT